MRKLSTTPILASIESLSHEGRGVATINGKKAFIFGALPGESVYFTLTASKKAYDEGDCVSVVGPASVDRQTPACPHFGHCGGCAMQHMDPRSVLTHKQSVLIDNLWHMAKIKPLEIVNPLRSDPLGYRRKARLGVRYVIKKEALLIGFRERKSNKLAIIDTCTILDPRLADAIQDLKVLIRSLSAFDTIAQIEVAMGEQGVALVIRHMQPLISSDKEAFVHFAERYASINLAIYFQPAGPDSVYCYYPKDFQLFYTLKAKTDSLRFAFEPLDFIQVNAQMNQSMLTQALEWLNCQAQDTILDLFCGLGNFTLPMAKQAAMVVGVEGSVTAIERAMMNAKKNDIQNVDFYVHDLTKGLDVEWASATYDKILIDPPRSGAQEIVMQIERWKARLIVYISCNPATFARDAGILADKGYCLAKVGIIDMFAQTAHIETMGLFVKI